MVLISKRIINYLCSRLGMNKYNRNKTDAPMVYNSGNKKDEKAFDYSFNSCFVCFL